MKPEALQTLSQLAVLVGIILTGLGGYGAFRFGKIIEKEALQTLSQIAVLVGLILTGLGGYGTFHFGKIAEEEARPPLSTEDVEKVRAQGLSYAAKVRSVPEAASMYEKEVRPLAQSLWEDSRYGEIAPSETALVYRVYAATLLFSRPTSGNTVGQVSSALPWLTRSVDLMTSAPTKPADYAELAAAHAFFNDVSNGKLASVDLQLMLRHQFRVAMPEASADAVDKRVENSLKLITGLVAPREQGTTSAKDDYEYLAQYRVGRFTIGGAMRAIQILTKARFPDKKVGGDPEFTPLPNGNTRVLYRFEGAVVVIYEWEVNKKKQLVQPLNSYSKELMEALASR
jgi:hypothetical protein